MAKPLTIGITQGSKWKNYSAWIKSKNIKVIKLSPKLNINKVESCDGIILSGGDDVHPKFYGKTHYMKKVKELRIQTDEARDKFEFSIIKKALANKIPLLGICRGLQIANVYFGGTLIPDIPTYLSKKKKQLGFSHEQSKGVDSTHAIKIKKGSLVNSLIPDTNKHIKPKANSSHHQSSDKIGRQLQATVWSADGVVEALEWKNPAKKSFLLLVQWHPERMKNKKLVFSEKIKEIFINACTTKN